MPIPDLEIPEASVIGLLPRSGDPEELGMLSEEGSELVGCVNEALAELVASGTIDEPVDTWLNQSGEIPSLTEYRSSGPSELFDHPQHPRTQQFLHRVTEAGRR